MLAVAAAIFVTVLWALFLSPKAAIPLPAVAAPGVEGILFRGTGAGLLSVDFGVPSVTGIVVWVVDPAVLGRTAPHRDSRA